jgi:hypothetical protein
MSRQTTALDAERHARRAYDAASRIVWTTRATSCVLDPRLE